MQVTTTFTIPPDPAERGDYIVFKRIDPKVRSPYDRVTFMAFHRPPFGFDDDPILTGSTGWTLRNVELIDVLLDKRDDLPIFTVVEVRGHFCRIEQVGGERIVRDLSGKWLSSTSIAQAIKHGTLELLS